MNNDNDLSQFEQRTRSVLRNSVDNLDGATRSRLTQARAAAMAQRNAGRNWFDFRYLAPTGAIAATLLFAMMFTGRHDVPGVNEPATGALYDLELLADADALELSEETDLEFIEWAAAMGEQTKVGT